MTAVVEPQFTEHLRVLWRVKWLAVAVAAIVAVGVFVVRDRTPARFESTAVVRLVVRNGVDLVLDQQQSILAAQTYARLATGPTVLAAGASAAALGSLAPDVIADRVTARAGTTPGFVEIVAGGPTARDARALADGVAAALATAVGAERRDATGVFVEARVEPAPEPATVEVPRRAPAEAAVAFVVAALFVAEAFALWRAARGALPLGDPAGAVRALLGIPCVAVRARPRDQAVRTLALFVVAHLGGRPIVTVAQRGRRGSSAGALLLAEAAAVLGQRSLLVDADLSDPVLGDTPGLSEVRRGGVAPVAVAWRQIGGVAPVVSAGVAGAEQAGTVFGGGLEETLAAFGADVVFLSTTSAVPALESLAVVARLPDCVVLVADPRRITKRGLLAAATELGSVGQDVVGVVLVGNAGGHRLGVPDRSFEPLVPAIPRGRLPYTGSTAIDRRVR
jgi:Mrp family chromosome partitioning ATPase